MVYGHAVNAIAPMLRISEDAYAARWRIGNEYALWLVLQESASDRYGRYDISPEEIEELRLLAQHANGWIWTGGKNSYAPQLVSFERWNELLEFAPDEYDQV